MASPPVSIAEVFYAGQDALMGKVHTSLPARVEAYDAAAQTAHCQPMVKRLMFDEAGEKVYESLPLLPHVPVCFPRGGGYVFVFPLAPGDFVWLNFSETAMAEYLATGKESAAWDNRRFHLSNAIAIPGVYPDTKPMTNGNTGGMVLGKDGAAEQVRIAPGEILVGGWRPRVRCPSHQDLERTGHNQARDGRDGLGVQQSHTPECGTLKSHRSVCASAGQPRSSELRSGDPCKSPVIRALLYTPGDSTRADFR